MTGVAHTLAALDRLAADEPLADRDAHMGRLAGGRFDVLVVGGGVTGAGVALDAAARGLRVALVEAGDFAGGTSSRSSKMIHGGFRYLQTGDLALVRESLRERHRLQRNAPHLAQIMPFMIPLFLKGGVINPKLSRALGAALWSYQLAGAWRLGRRHRRLSQGDVARHMPTLDMERVGGGYLFHDLRVDDARLVIAVLSSAAARGAVVVNHARCTALSEFRNGARIVRIATDGADFDVSARMVVNATGVWAQAFLGGVGIESARRLTPAKGTHIVLPIELMRNDVAVSLPAGPDRRTLSVVAEGPFAYVGSTETTDPADIDRPGVSESDIDYILDGINRHLSRPVTRDDVTSGWAGFRPLVADARTLRSSDLSRRHSIETVAEGVVTVTGGKLTTYREMAEGTVDQVCAALGHKARCTTRRLRLHGYAALAGTPGDGDHIAIRYGDRAPDIRALAAQAPELAEQITPRGETIMAEAVWGLRAEMACSLADTLFRRTRIATYDGRAVLADADRIAARVGRLAGWGENRIAAETETLKSVLQQELGALAQDLPAAP